MTTESPPPIIEKIEQNLDAQPDEAAKLIEEYGTAVLPTRPSQDGFWLAGPT